MRDLTVALFSERARIFPPLVVLVSFLTVIILLFQSPALVTPLGKPYGADFITFWSAGKLTLEGRPEAAFDMKEIVAVQRQAVPGSDAVFLWHYPPMFQVVSAGLALMPYLTSYFVFMGLSLVAYAGILRHYIGTRDAVMLLLAYPGVLIAVLHGQNSLLSAALMGGALLMLDRRPVLAGVLIGLLAYKPQLGLLFPLVLALTGRWRTFAAAAATVGVVVVVSTLLLGTDLWRVFLSNTSTVRSVVENGQLPWSKMPSAFVFASMLGASETLAYAAQWIVALSVVATVGWIWYRVGATPFSGAALVTGTLLLPPYMFDYEFVILIIPIAVLAVDMAQRGATLFEKVLIVFLFVVPPRFAMFATLTGVQVGFLLLLLIFVLVVRRALARPDAERSGPTSWLPGRMFSTVN